MTTAPTIRCMTMSPATAELVVATFSPIRERTQRILADEAGLDRVLAHGAAQARLVAGQTMAAVRDRMGLLKPAD